MPENRITESHVDALLDNSNVETSVMHGKETLSTFLLPNGFTITGRSACVDPANFDAELGLKIAREDAKRQLWAFEGYRLQCHLSKASILWDGTNIEQVDSFISGQRGPDGESFILGESVHISGPNGIEIASIGTAIERSETGSVSIRK